MLFGKFWKKGAHNNVDQTRILAQCGDLTAIQTMMSRYPQGSPDEIFWRKQASKHGDLNSTIYLANHYQHQNEIDLALQYLSEAAPNHADCAYQLACLYREEKVIGQDMQQSLTWLEMAANLGHADAQFEAGLAYDDEGVQHDSAKSERYLLMAANQGHIEAQYTYALHCHLNKPPKYQQAFKWFNTVGSKHPQADYYLGLYHEKGYIGHQDLEQAITHYQKLESHPRIQLRIAKCMVELGDENHVDQIISLLSDIPESSGKIYREAQELLQTQQADTSSTIQLATC